MRMPFRNRRGRAGNAMVEFAIASTLLIPALGGSFQFGYTFYQYNLLTAAVTNGARYGANRTYRSANGGADLTKVQTAVKNVVVYGSPAGGSVPQVRGLQPSHVNVSFLFSGTQVPTSIQVKIVGFTVDGIFKSYTFNNSPVLTYPYTGRFAPEESEP
jgi:Flp pilus assembly protein TadG